MTHDARRTTTHQSKFLQLVTKLTQVSLKIISLCQLLKYFYYISKGTFCQLCETTPENWYLQFLHPYTKSHKSSPQRQLSAQITERGTSCCSSPRNNQVDILLKKIFTLFKSLFNKK